MNKRALEMQADKLEQALAVHDAPGRVTGGTVLPRMVTYTVYPQAHVKTDKVRGLAEDLARAIGAESVRVSRRGRALSVEVPRSEPQPVRLLPLMRQLAETKGNIPPVTAVLGLAEDGAPLLIRLPSPDVAHVLVAGCTGSGKSALLRSMVLSLALTHEPRELALVLVDVRGGQAFDVFGGLSHLARSVVRDVGEAVEALTSLVRLMELRDAERVTVPAVVLVVDELADLLMTGGEAASFGLRRLVQRGRGAGIHVIAATQKPTAAVLGPLVKANFPVRLVGRVTSTEDARTAAGVRATGAERLSGRGDFLAVAEGRVVRFQAAYIEEQAIAGELARHGWEAPEPQPAARLADPTPEPQRVRVDVILPEPTPEVDPIDELAERLRAMEWDPSESYRSACRALDMAEGGGPFAQVQAAVDRLREGALRSERSGAVGATATATQKDNGDGQRSDGRALLSCRSSSSTLWAAAALEWEGEGW